MKKELLAVAMLLFAGGNLLAQPHVNDGTSYLMNQPLDMSTDFRDLSNTNKKPKQHQTNPHKTNI